MAAAGGTGGQSGGGGGVARASDAAGRSRPRQRLRGGVCSAQLSAGPAPRSRVGTRRERDEKGAPERPLPFIKQPKFNLSPLLRLRSQPGGANLRMGRDRGFRSSLLPPDQLPATQAEPPPPPSLSPLRIESSRSLREAPPSLDLAPYWQRGKSTRLPIGCKGSSSKAPRPGLAPTFLRLLNKTLACESRPRNARRAPGKAVTCPRRLALLGSPEVGRGVNPGWRRGVQRCSGCGC